MTPSPTVLRAGTRGSALALAQTESVGLIRKALDTAGRTDTAILAYSAKYASAFYGPFRDAVQSSLVYQVSGENAMLAIEESVISIRRAGADAVLTCWAAELAHSVRRR